MLQWQYYLFELLDFFERSQGAALQLGIYTYY